MKKTTIQFMVLAVVGLFSSASLAAGLSWADLKILENKELNDENVKRVIAYEGFIKEYEAKIGVAQKLLIDGDCDFQNTIDENPTRDQEKRLQKVNIDRCQELRSSIETLKRGVIEYTIKLAHARLVLVDERVEDLAGDPCSEDKSVQLVQIEKAIKNLEADFKAMGPREAEFPLKRLKRMQSSVTGMYARCNPPPKLINKHIN